MSLFEKNKPNPDLEVFAIYDSKVEAYGDPKFAINQHDFIRGILNMFKDPANAQNQFFLNAEDFSLFKIGSYTRKTGTFVPQQPTHCVNLHELRAISDRERAGNAQDVGPRAL
jgi:hypothetical protein